MQATAPRCRGARFVALLLMIVSAAVPAPAKEEDPVKARESELQQLTTRITDLRAEIADSRQRREALREELQQTERRIGEAVRRLRETEAEIETQRGQVAALEAQRQKERRELDRQQAVLGRQLRAAYAMGRQERLKLMLNQQDPAEISRVLGYYRYFNRARRESIDRVNGVIAQLGRTEAEIRRQEAQLLVVLGQQEREKAELEASREARAPILAALAEEIEDKNQRLRRLEEDAKALQGVIDRLQRERLAVPLDAEGGKPFGTLKGKLAWPAAGTLRARFGSPKEGNLKWEGVLISAREGQPVKAVHHGRVVFSDWLRGFGLLIIVDHGDGYMTLYGHNESVFKEAGEWVQPDEVIGSVGVTGGRSKPASYFGIRHKGRPVDPQRWCRRGKGNRVGS